jgi:hypothetical protein
MKLNWQTSDWVSCLHAAEACLRAPSGVDSRLAQVLTAPASLLEDALSQEGIATAIFWSHGIPLAAGTEGSHELAELALIKTIGRADARPRAAFFRGLLVDIRNAYLRVVPDLEKEIASGRQALQMRWNREGQSLLGGLEAWTEPGILVDEAAVIPVYPALGGGGAAHLAYNSVRLEAVAADPCVDLPEVMRLTWLLSQLNLDLPRYSENVRPNRLPLVGGLAMIPVVLSVAAQAGATAMETRIAPAVEAWVGGEETAARVETLKEWWDSYRALRPSWATALPALDQLLA